MSYMPKTSFDFASHLPDLDERGWVPQSALCVYVSGSLLLGWGNATSDADYYVITEDEWTGETNNANPTSAEPGFAPSLATYVGDRRFDIEYWRDEQIGQLIDNVSWPRYEEAKTLTDLVTNHDSEVLHRLLHAKALRGGEWLERRQADLRASALRAVWVRRNLYYTDVFVEDAAGQLEGGDLKSATLSARTAFGFAVDALLASTGGVGGSTPANKWRARHLSEIDQAIIPFDEYWAVETMRDYDPDRPAAWVEQTVLACRRICTEIDVE